MKKVFLVAIFLSKQLYANAQNVGIGTNNPSRAKLEVHGAVGATSAIFGGESSGISLQRNWPGIGFNQYYNDGSKYIGTGFGAVQFVDPNSGYMAIDMLPSGSANGDVWSSRRALVITNDGKINIGSADLPSATLSVARGSGFLNDATAVIHGSFYPSYFNLGSRQNTYIRAGLSGGTVFINDIPDSKIAMSGSVGINTADPSYPLEIRQPNADKGLVLVNANNWHNWEFRVTGADGSLWFYRDAQARGHFFPDGHYSQVSDNRLKTNIQTLPSLLDKVMQLQPVKYQMKHQNSSHQNSIGFVAQDVKELFPELVTLKSDTTSGYEGITDLHSLNYSGFGILAIKAIQEQQQIIQTQQQSIQSLQQQVEQLKKTMNQIITRENTIGINEADSDPI